MTNTESSAVAGVPAAQSIVAFAEGRYDDVVDLLLPVRRLLHRFGGSHAQRDAMQRTLIESAIRSGQHQSGGRLLRERLSLRPSGDFATDPDEPSRPIRQDERPAASDMVYTQHDRGQQRAGIRQGVKAERLLDEARAERRRAAAQAHQQIAGALHFDTVDRPAPTR